MSIHEKYMQRCLELAKKGFGMVAPNPMVGCVVIYKDKSIGEGFHMQYGSAHAEVNAINSVEDKSLLKHSTLYINLEPCSHFGKTPPCADLIIGSGIKYVVIGCIDPNPLVKGKGMQKLISSGCDVKVGVLENECRELNRRFYTFYEKKRPYIILKWASTADGYIGIKNEKPVVGKVEPLKITNDAANKIVHQWRSEEQAIMVGTNTALMDDPQLTVRHVQGKNPLRVLLDKELKVSQQYHLLDGSTSTIVFTEKEKKLESNIEYVSIDFSRDVLKQVMNELFKRNIQSVIVEGGANLLNSFIQENLWDEARVLTGTKKLNELSNNGNGLMEPEISGKVISQEVVSGDRIKIIRNIS